MADKHPYVPSAGGLTKVFNHFRKSYPARVTAETLKKLGYAPKNESYVLNVLRYLALIDEEGKQTTEAGEAFSQHNDKDFAKKFAAIVKKAYSDLFDLHGDGAWMLDQEALITFFRSSDQTSAIVGKRQAIAFQLLAAFAGHAEIPEVRNSRQKSEKNPIQKKKKKVAESKTLQDGGNNSGTEVDLPSSKVGLTVRIEINLPADGDQKTYDRIFMSIRENLLNG